MELSNGMIVSGDCENIILWDYININNNLNNNNIYMPEKDKEENSFFGAIKKFFFGPGKNDDEKVLIISGRNSVIPFSEYKIIENQKLYNVYSIIEIKDDKKNENDENKEIIIAAAEPDSKTINFMKIEKTKRINKLKKIECHDEIAKKKNIMKYFDNKLFVGCKNKLIVIDINKYEIIYNVYSESITYINSFLDKYLICGVSKKLNNLYDYEGYLCQKNILKNPISGKIKIINISSFNKFKLKGNIIDSCIDNKNCIITATYDDKILILKYKKDK